MYNLITLVLSMATHAYLDRQAALSYLKRWKPTVSSSGILEHDLNHFTRAVIQLQDPKSCGFVDEKENLYLVRVQEDSTLLRKVMWKNERQVKGRRLVDLKQWHDCTFRNHTLYGNTLLDDDDLAFWTYSI